MASSRVSGAGVVLQIDVEGLKKTEESLRDARRRISRRMGEIAKLAGEETVLPRAKESAIRYRIEKTPVAGSLKIVRSGKGAALTTSLRGKKGRALGLLEFGGRVSSPIYPKARQALAFGGRVVSRVTTPRTYHGRHFLMHAVESELGRFGTVVRDKALDEFRAEGFEVT